MVVAVVVVAVKANLVLHCDHQSMCVSSFSKLGNSKVVDKAILAKHIIMSQLLTFASVLASPLQALGRLVKPTEGLPGKVQPLTDRYLLLNVSPFSLLL